MKQEADATGAAGLPSKRTPDSQKAQKPAKNLYDPYDTPRLPYEVLRNIVKLIFFLITRIHLRGRYNVPRMGPYIIAANHLSWTDIPLIPAYVPGKVVYMAKEEAFHSRVGWLVRFLGAFPVKRGEADRQAIRTAETQLKQGKTFIIFPEGTRSKTRTLALGHTGLGMIALRSGAPVVPVAIWGSENALKKFGADITISYGAPVVFKPKGKKITREEIQHATDEVMRQIAAMLPARYRGVYSESVQAAQNVAGAQTSVVESTGATLEGTSTTEAQARAVESPEAGLETPVKKDEL